MRTPSFGRCSSKRSSGYSREFELPQSQHLETSSSLPAGDGSAYGAMLPIFLDDLRRNHQQELVEITLELEGDALVLCDVAPTTTISTASSSNDEVGGAVERSLSITSRIRRKFPWLRSSSSRSLASASASEVTVEDPVITARNARKMKAKLERTRSSAQRALRGLRFISKTTGATDADELWRKVEERFRVLAKDGLLAREDFGECIGDNAFCI